MSYDIHITRADDYLSDTAPITLDEVLRTVVPLPEGFRAERNAGADSALVYDGGGDARAEVWIWFTAGQCPFFTVSSEEYMRPVIRLAECLGAKVQGDEGEIYPAAESRRSRFLDGLKKFARMNARLPRHL